MAAPGGETVFDPDTEDVLVAVPPLSEKKLYPNEKALVDLVAAERLEGRRVLVYVTHTGTRDITGRLNDILTQHGFRTEVLKADTVSPDRREAWVEQRVKEGVDVVLSRVSEVLRPAIRENCPSIIVVHNHPSGDPAPSAEDILVTRDIGAGADMLGIELLDHIIIGGQGFISLKDKGLGFGDAADRNSR